MRLGQLARKLDVSTSEIVKLCASEFKLDVPHHPNAKIQDEIVGKLELHFSRVEDLSTEVEAPNLIHEEIITNKKESDASNDSLDDEPEQHDVELNLEDGVIKAPKIDLPKPKVVGKIELPAPKVLEEQAEEEVVNDDLENNTNASSVENSENEVKTALAEEKSIKRKRSQNRKSSRSKSGKKREVKVLTYEEEVRLKKEAYEKQRAAEIAAEKERKKRNYEQLMKKRQSEVVKPKKKKKNQETAQNREVKEKPTSLWGKFLYWLNN